MNERTPVEPHPVAGRKGLIAFFVGEAQAKMPEPAPGIAREPAEPRKSFFRGVAVGLAVMIPIWVWVILRFIH